MTLGETATVKSNMTKVYDLTNDRLSTFYQISYDSDMTSKHARELGDDQTKLLDQLLILLNTPWIHVISRMRITNEIRKNIANMLRLLSSQFLAQGYFSGCC
jgi:hypothetical protein